MALRKVISGGQTGADQGGLEGARRAGVETGGWAPRNFLTEDGPQPELETRYGLEACNGGYDERTALNVEAADATALFARDVNSDGTKLTLAIVAEREQPFVLNPTAGELRAFLTEHLVEVLNVAGNRESVAPGIAAEVEHVVYEALRG